MFRTLAVAALVSTIGAANPVAEQSQQAQAQEQTQRQGQGQGQGRGGRGNPAEQERRFREAISNQITRRLQLTDSVMANRIASLSFRYRDSAMVIEDRERFVRRAMAEEGASTQYGRVPNDERLRCLMDEFFVLQERRVALRRSEDREISTLLPTVGRYRYLALQENLHDMMDEFVDDLRRARNGRAGPRGAGADSGRAGPPPARAGGPPPGARGGPPPLFGRALGARGQYANICPAR